MNGSPSAIILGGFGSGTFNGSPSLIVTMGYGIGEAVVDVSANYGWLEYTVEGRMHYSLPEGRIHYGNTREDRR